MSRVVVLGAGVAGLVAAAAAAADGHDVLMLERDRPAAGLTRRRGAPQANQLHNLLQAALTALETLAPGFGDRIAAEGAVFADVSRQTYVHELGQRMPERSLGLTIATAELPAIERALRELVLADGRIELRVDSSVEDVSTGSEGINGVWVRGVREAADVVVDALGAGSPVAGWLGHLLMEDRQPVRHWYSTALYRLAPGVGEPYRFWMVFPFGGTTRGCLVARLRDGFVRVSVSGRADDRPPRSSEEHQAAVRMLADPVLDALLAHLVPDSGPTLFRRANATWRHWEENPVPGLLPVGDAFATLDPLFGQGMSVAALQALALGPALADRSATHDYLAAAARTARLAWDLGQGGPDDPSLPSAAATRGGVEAFVELLGEDLDLHRTYVGIWHLLEPADALQRPDIADRLLQRCELVR